MSRTLLVAALLVAGISSGCMKAYQQSLGGEGVKVQERIFLTDFNTAWQAVLDALKNSRLDVSNREGGFIQTKWAENTAEKNFVDSFGGADSYLKAQIRIRATVAKAYYNGQPAVKIAIQKEQIVQRDVLEGWKGVETDATDENTLLYRVGRLILIRMKLAKIEEEKTKHALEHSGF